MSEGTVVQSVAQETSTIQCKVCNEMKVRILAGSFDGKTKKWVDEAGGTFNGRVCPGCHRRKVRDHMRTKREKTQS